MDFLTKNMRYTITLIILLLGLVACDKPLPPEIQNIENVEIVKLDLKENNLIVGGDIVVFNPNAFACKIKGADVKVWLDDKEAGVIEKDIKTSLAAKDVTRVPIKFNCSTEGILKKEGFLNNVLSALSNKEVDARFKGKIILDVAGVGIPIPINHQEKLELKLKGLLK